MSQTRAFVRPAPVIRRPVIRRPVIRRDVAITEERDLSLGRTERRLLRRIFNGRTVPIIADGRPFLTYKEASRYLLSLTDDARDQAYAQMSRGQASGSTHTNLQ